MSWRLPYPKVLPLPETAEHQDGWLRDVIMGAQAPHFISTGEPAAVWADMNLQKLAGMLGPETQVNMIIAPEGVVGYYNTGLVQVTVREGFVWGKAAVSHLQPQEEIKLPHVQMEGTLGVLAEHLAKPHRDPFIAPSERVYLRTSENVLPRVQDYVARGIPTDEATFEALSVYLSQADTVTNLHWDLRSGAIQQLRGRKRVVIFPPTELSKLPMHAMDHILARRSRIDGRLDEAAFAKFAALQQVRGVVCDVGPGDWLYLPAGCLHHVTTLDDDCISLIIIFRR